MAAIPPKAVWEERSLAVIDQAAPFNALLSDPDMRSRADVWNLRCVRSMGRARVRV